MAKFSAWSELVISPPLLHRQRQEARISLAAVKKPPALHSDKIREHSVLTVHLRKIGLAKLDGSGLVEAEEFLGHVVLLLVGDQAGEEGKQHHRVAQVSVVVLQRLQGCLSQNFIHCLKVVESLDKPFLGY